MDGDRVPPLLARDAAYVSEYSDEDLRLGQISMRCPFHDDSLPSLSINLTKGIWHCHAGANCGGGGIVAFEERLGDDADVTSAVMRVKEKLGITVRPKPKSKPIVESEHVYHDAQRKPLYKIVRHSDRASQRRYVVGKWRNGIQGVARPLYNLPAIADADLVIVTEGEKKADILTYGASPFSPLVLDPDGRDIRYTVTTTGSWNTWKPEHTKALKGKYVLLLHDADEGGQKYRAAIESSLKGEGIPFRSVECGVGEFLDKDCRPMISRMEANGGAGVERLLRVATYDWPALNEQPQLNKEEIAA